MIEQRLIAEFNMNSLQTIKAHLIGWKSQWYVDVRIWEKRNLEKPGTEKPTIRGVRFNSGLLPDLIRLLSQVQQAADKKYRPQGVARKGEIR